MKLEVCCLLDRGLPEWRRDQEAAISQVASDLSTMRVPDSPRETSLSLSCVPLVPGDQRVWSHPDFRPGHGVDTSALLWLSTDIRVDENRSELTELLMGVLLWPINLEGLIHELSLALTIAFPGLLDISTALVFRDGNAWGCIRTPWRSRIADARGLLLDEELDPFARLAPSQVLEWLRGVPGYRFGVGEGRVGRAVSCLAHIGYIEYGGGEANATLSELAWAVVGLEALFTHHGGQPFPMGQTSTRRQVADGICRLLGESAKIRQLVHSMYSVRSQHLHGERAIEFPWPFPRRMKGDLDWRRLRRFRRDVDSPLDQAVCTAVLLLLMCVQHLASRGQYELE